MQGVAILFSKYFTPVSYEVEEILKGRILKIRTVFENEVLVFFQYMHQLHQLKELFF